MSGLIFESVFWFLVAGAVAGAVFCLLVVWGMIWMWVGDRRCRRMKDEMMCGRYWPSPTLTRKQKEQVERLFGVPGKGRVLNRNGATSATTGRREGV